MPASPSRKREPDRPAAPRRAAPPGAPPRPPARLIWPIALFGLLVIGVVATLALPASLVTRFLPPPVHAEDFSGSIWHGSAARIAIDSRPVGALEWRLHPLALLSMQVVADLHWVKGGTVIDGLVKLDAKGFEAHDVHGGGPVEDLRDLGVPPGWQGNTTLDLREIQGSFATITAATGTIDVSALASAAIAAGTDLGSYQVILGPDAVNPDSITAMIKDTGGPLEARGELHYTPASHSGLLTAKLKERAQAGPALRNELNNLTQMRPRDADGRVPIDLEFSL